MRTRNPKIIKTATLPDKTGHQVLALWAADCAGHVLRLFETICPEDERPRQAIEAGRAWARAGLPPGKIRAASLAAHAAARATENPAARAAARAAGQAAATGHMAGHAPHAAAYAVKAAVASGIEADVERKWQARLIPKSLHRVAFPRLKN